MAETEKAGTSAERLGVPAAKVGQMLHRLELASNSVQDTRAGSRWGWGTHLVRVFTTDEIKSAFGLDDETYARCIEEYRITINPDWNTDKIETAFIAFVIKHKRWPKGSEFSRKHGLPASSTCLRWGRPLNRLQQAFITRRARSLTPELIRSIQNLTTRRNAITAYGIEKFVQNGGGERVTSDEFGVLWRIPVVDGGDSEIRYVEVVNKSPRINEETRELILENGAPIFDHYFLRVPPTTRTPREGIAWGYTLEPAGFTGFAAES